MSALNVPSWWPVETGDRVTPRSWNLEDSGDHPQNTCNHIQKPGTLHGNIWLLNSTPNAHAGECARQMERCMCTLNSVDNMCITTKPMSVSCTCWYSHNMYTLAKCRVNVHKQLESDGGNRKLMVPVVSPKKGRANLHPLFLAYTLFIRAL